MSGYRRRGALPAPSEQAVALARARTTRALRHRPVLGVLASLASLGLVAVLLVEPSGLTSAATLAAAGDPDAAIADSGQTVLVADVRGVLHKRDVFDVVKVAPPRPSAPAVGVPDPGTAQAIAYKLVVARGWDAGEFDCLVALWNKESHWNVFAHNANSGAYGIPQAMPGSKMASAGADWETNPRTQIVWGLGYIAGRYGTPCVAWGNSQTRGWY